MIVGDLSLRELGKQLGAAGLAIQFGPFNLTIRSNLESFASLAHRLYEPYPLPGPGEIADFHVGIASPRGLRRWVRRQASFTLDGQSPFAPYTVEHAFPALEWGINWCVATRAHHLLMLHSAGIERNGLAMLFPASPGDGKSTLCTALIHSGWRLMSDEFGLVRPEDGMLLPLPRLIPLKNESIDVIRRFRPEAIIGPAFLGTRKGTVAHVRPPAESIRRAQEAARPRWFVFPRWIANAPLALEPMPKSRAFLMVATNAFNYEVLDETAFRLVAEMVRTSDCYSLSYSDLDEAVAALDELSNAVDG
ncbi:MAG: HprK-related kinase A [Candidatus Accumulibacter sp.]|jgi:HprK-related kinase A|uniref:HprK-related kinase A n=1 Tax=Candidatus Accumulibacter affinis TaxID=2954384 RepID=A0A935W6J6_9PROT|nr:HprK-related kinase A [Candidatus Accumulibacter affinis]MBP9806205.1 HprK-related kinase A [Accumulibacter sp.]